METPVTQQNAPLIPLRTNRGAGEFFILTLLTASLYSIVVFSHISTEINDIASRHDGKRTMHYCLVLVLGLLTFGIVPLVWMHQLSNRIGDELRRRRLPRELSATTFWGWCIAGAFIGVGPIIYIHKLMHAINYLAADYNRAG